MATKELSRRRRNSKGTMTRAVNLLKTALGSDQVNPETIVDLFKRVTTAFEAVEMAHCSLIEVIEDDNEYEKEEEWMEGVQSTFLEVRLLTEGFLSDREVDSTVKSKDITDNSMSKGKEDSKADKATALPSDTSNTKDVNKQSVEASVLHSDKLNEASSSTATVNSLSNFNEIKLALELPKMEYSKFAGNPIEYYSFITNFEVNIEAKLSSNPARLQHLKTMCTGKARSYIECCDLLGESGYSEAKRILQTQFGQPHMILNALMRELTDRNPIRPNDSDSLWELIALMKKCQVTLTKLGYTNDLNSTTNLLKIQDLLPTYLQTSWVKNAHDILTKEKREPAFNDLLDFLVRKAEVSSTMFGKYLAQSKTTSSKKGQGQKQVNVKSNHVSSKPIKCFICNGNHRIYTCKELLECEYEQRVSTVKSKRLCFRCLMPGHIVSRCQRTWKCDCGSEKHHNLLHPPTEEVQVSSGVVTSGSKVYMRILPVTVMAKNGNQVNTLALLDHGSDASLCSNHLRKKLGVKGDRVKYTSSTIHGNQEKEGWRFELTIKGKYAQENMTLEFLTVPKIPASVEGIPTVKELKKWRHLKSLPWEEHLSQEVDVLIGADSPQAFWVLEEKKGGPKDPYGIRTPLGWSIMGPGGQTGGQGFFNRIHVSNQQLLEEVQRSWAVENSGLYEEQDSVEDVRARKVIESTIKKTKDGHYEMGLLWKRDQHDMPLNRGMAESRLESLKKRLSSDKDMHAAYTEVIEGYIEKGYAEPVLEVGLPGKIWYLPHHPVVHPHKKKVRVVYDCAARFAGTSLNDQLLKGPDFMNDLLGVLLRFRRGRVAIVSDIEAMFHQVRMTQPDRDFLRFLWWDGGNMSTPTLEYRMCVHLFGATSSPCCASKALKQTADDNKLANGDAVGKQALEIIRHGFYVDDCLGSVQNVEVAIQIVKRLSDILQKGGFRLTKWLSNEREVLESVDESERAPSVQLPVDRLPTERTLGVSWNAESDCFTFQLTTKERPMTRRGLLSVTSSFFDPLGIASPFVLIGKSILQEVCRRGADWDQPLTDEEQSALRKWLECTQTLSQVSVPRWLKTDANTEAKLHIFCDASEKGYAAVAYLRVEQGSGSHTVEFVLGKSRVSPLRIVTIPRLELMAAVLAATLDNTIRREIRYSLGNTTFWSDSMIVLSYLRNESKRYKTFVANRIAKILSVSSRNQWRHVPSEENPADEGSRGTYQLGKWLTGPDFLSKGQEFWPAAKFDYWDEFSDDREVRRNMTVNQANLRQVVDDNVSFISGLADKFSSWTCLLRVLAWVMRFVKSMKAKIYNKTIVKGSLLVSELTESEAVIISSEQKRTFPDWKFNKRLTPLCPVLLGKLLKVGGRLSNACIDDSAKHPIILDKGRVAELLVLHYHRRVGHSGWAATLNAMRQQYWVLKGKSLVKTMLRKCVTCNKHHARRGEQIMAALPEERVTPDEPPFNCTGVDYFGPLDVKQGHSTVKRYGCLFTCLASRAVHIELADSLNADSFINAYRRFVARRGEPSKLFSDNGSNFVASDKELKASLSQMKQSQVEDFLHTRGVEWSFNPPTASHFGGAWERLIRSVRRILNGIIRQQKVDNDVLHTVLTEVEAILNSRPLTELSPEAFDKEPLTPNHLLLLRGGPSSPVGKIEAYGKRRWLQAQYLASLFWSRWKKEYLPLLQKRNKWTIPKKDVQIGDIVLLVDEVLPRGRWLMGKVIAVFQSKDGRVRSVDVKVATGTLKRPITKLCIVHRTPQKESSH